MHRQAPLPPPTVDSGDESAVVVVDIDVEAAAADVAAPGVSAAVVSCDVILPTMTAGPWDWVLATASARSADSPDN